MKKTQLAEIVIERLYRRQPEFSAETRQQYKRILRWQKPKLIAAAQVLSLPAKKEKS